MTFIEVFELDFGSIFKLFETLASDIIFLKPGLLYHLQSVYYQLY
jgi:hypothetical protein